MLGDTDQVRARRARRVQDLLELLLRRFALAERADMACCGMTVAQAATLGMLARHGGMRAGTLSVRLGISPSTLSRNLNRLEQRGLILRRPDPADRRVTEVRLSDDGRAAASQVEAQEQAFMVQVMDVLSERESRAAVEGLEALLRAVRIATESCCPGAFEFMESGNEDERTCCDE